MPIGHTTLSRRVSVWLNLLSIGALGVIRTLDPEIKSFMLYQLSYEHIINKVHFGQAVSYPKTKFEYSAQFISIVFFFGGTMNI